MAACCGALGDHRKRGKREPGEGKRSRGSEKGQGLRGVADGVGGDGAPLGGGEREPEKGGRRHGESARPGRVCGVADGVQGDERK